MARHRHGRFVAGAVFFFVNSCRAIRQTLLCACCKENSNNAKSVEQNRRPFDDLGLLSEHSSTIIMADVAAGVGSGDGPSKRMIKLRQVLEKVLALSVDSFTFNDMHACYPNLAKKHGNLLSGYCADLLQGIRDNVQVCR